VPASALAAALDPSNASATAGKTNSPARTGTPSTPATASTARPSVPPATIDRPTGTGAANAMPTAAASTTTPLPAGGLEPSPVNAHRQMAASGGGLTPASGTFPAPTRAAAEAASASTSLTAPQRAEANMATESTPGAKPGSSVAAVLPNSRTTAGTNTYDARGLMGVLTGQDPSAEALVTAASRAPAVSAKTFTDAANPQLPTARPSTASLPSSPAAAPPGAGAEALSPTLAAKRTPEVAYSANSTVRFVDGKANGDNTPPAPARASAPVAAAPSRPPSTNPPVASDSFDQQEREPGPRSAKERDNVSLQRDIKARLLGLQHALRALAPLPRHAASTSARADGPATTATDAGTALYTARGTVPRTDASGATALRGDIATPGDTSDIASSRSAQDTLMRLVEGALARTHVQQITTLTDARPGGDTAPLGTWAVDIPISHGRDLDLVELRIEDHGADQDGQQSRQRRWQIMMRIDITSLGVLHALVQLSGQRLGTTLWAERPDTLGVMRQALHELTGVLEAQGVSVERLECRLGSPEPRQLRRFGELLDVRT
jgi:Flagellar hook-length control protein FliK